MSNKIFAIWRLANSQFDTKSHVDYPGMQLSQWDRFCKRSKLFECMRLNELANNYMLFRQFQHES